MKLLGIIAITLLLQGGLSQNHSVGYFENGIDPYCSVKENTPTFEEVNPKGAWIDIPTSEYALPEDSVFENIKRTIDYFHTINNLNVSLLPERISTLEGILIDIQQINFAPVSHLQKKAIKFELLVKKKLWYLKEIQSLYSNPDPYQKYIDLSQIRENSSPLILVNKLAFDPNLPMYWGLFLLEALDPCHRFLTQYYVKWFKGPKDIPFFIWLEDQEILFDTFQITYFTDLELAKYKINIIDGYLYNDSDGKFSNFDSEDKEYLFSLSIDRKLFVAEGDLHIRHTSLTAGKAALGSGTLKIKNGILTYIDTESGHYQPSPHSLKQVFAIFQEEGLLLDYDNINVKYYTESGIIHESAALFLKKFIEEFNTNHKIEDKINNLKRLIF